MLEENRKVKKQVEFFESKYKNIDLDRLHEKVAFLSTRYDQSMRDVLLLSQLIRDLTGQIDLATKNYLKIRKVRELDWDLPAIDSVSVINRDWRKLMEMEKKAFDLVDSIATSSIETHDKSGLNIKSPFPSSPVKSPKRKEQVLSSID